LKPDLDAIEALAPEREALWTRIDKATFLTQNEKRAAVGYGPVEVSDPAGLTPSPGDIGQKFNPNHDELGRFTFGPDGAVDGSERPQPARARTGQRPPRPPARRQPPPAPPASRPHPHTDLAPPQPLEPQEAIDAYRAVHNMPPGVGTVAFAKIDGTPYLGVNSTAPGYTDADYAAAVRMRDMLVEKYPDVMRAENPGWKPNDALFHAEATTLLRAAEANGGTLAGRTIAIRVDRDMCWSCDAVLPLVGLELGNPSVTIIDPTGSRGTMRNGTWRR